MKHECKKGILTQPYIHSFADQKGLTLESGNADSK